MYQKYPTGFRTELGLGTKSETQPDAELVRFMERLAKNEINVLSWKVRNEFFQIAKRLYGGFGQWIDAQQENPNISQTAYDMIADTLDFISGKARTISVQTRFAIMNTESANGAYNRSVEGRRSTPLRDHMRFPSNEFMYRWVNQPDGFSDMLCTTNLIFGKTLRD